MSTSDLCQLPDQYCECATLKGEEKEARCLSYVHHQCWKKKKKNIVTSSGCSQMRYMIRCCICDVEQRHQKQNKKKANMSTGSRKGADHLFLASLPAKVLCAFCLCVCGCTRVCLLSPSLCDVLLQPNESAPVLFFCACACLCYEIYPLITEGESQPLGACCRAG